MPTRTRSNGELGRRIAAAELARWRTSGSSPAPSARPSASWNAASWASLAGCVGLVAARRSATRCSSTMFAAGVPLVEALDSVGGAAGNYVYMVATKQIQNEVSTGTALTVAMQNSNIFPAWSSR